MSDLGKSCVSICRIEATTYANDLDSNSNTLPATAQHIVAAGQTSAGPGQVNELGSTASLFSKTDSIDSIVKGAPIL